MKPLEKEFLAPSIISISIVVMVFYLLGLIPSIIIGGASISGFILYINTFYKFPIDTDQLIAPYLITILFFIIHVYEEYVYDFEHILTQLNEQSISEFTFLSSTVFLGTSIWIVGAILLVQKHFLRYYFLSFFFIAMSISELIHFAFPFIIYGDWVYTAGAFTAILPLFPAWYGAYHSYKEIQKLRAEIK